MNFNALEFKVGLLVVTVASIIAWMSLKVAEGPGFLGGGTTHYFDVADAGGLVNKGAVKVAGIKVGVIDKIMLKDGLARVFINIDDEVPLRQGSHVEIKADGILGDRHVEIIPGPSTAPLITQPTQFSVESSGGSLDTIAKEVSKITDSLSEFSKNLNKATGVGDETTSIGRIVSNLEKLTADLAEVSGQNKQRIHEIIERVHSITGRVDEFLADENGEFDQAWSDIRDIIHRFDNTMKNFEEVSHKVNSGEGTLGQLINDDETINNINKTVEGVNEFLGSANELQTSLDFHSEFMSEEDRNKNYISARITPGLDRYYEIGIVTDPQGLISRKRTTTTGSTTTDVNETTTFFDKVKFTALFAKNFYDFTLKGGLIESKGGVGFDYFLLDNRLRLSVEAFDFDDMYLRSFVRYNIVNGVYLTVGGDNLLSNRDLNAAAFVGAGLFLTNDDLKNLVSRISL